MWLGSGFGGRTEGLGIGAWRRAKKAGGLRGLTAAFPLVAIPLQSCFLSILRVWSSSLPAAAILVYRCASCLSCSSICFRLTSPPLASPIWPIVDRRQMAKLHALDMDTGDRDPLIFRTLEVGK